LARRADNKVIHAMACPGPHKSKAMAQIATIPATANRTSPVTVRRCLFAPERLPLSPSSRVFADMPHGAWNDKGCNPGEGRTERYGLAADRELADYCRMDKTMLTEKEIADARATLNELQVEHRDLNLIVEHLAATPLPNQDQLLIQRLKKRKLVLKDKIYQLEKMLVPDISA
jgi:hypothetical protein